MPPNCNKNLITDHFHIKQTYLYNYPHNYWDQLTFTVCHPVHWLILIVCNWFSFFLIFLPLIVVGKIRNLIAGIGPIFHLSYFFPGASIPACFRGFLCYIGLNTPEKDEISYFSLLIIFPLSFFYFIRFFIETKPYQ